jgi:hypothetical protein
MPLFWSLCGSRKFPPVGCITHNDKAVRPFGPNPPGKYSLKLTTDREAGCGQERELGVLYCISTNFLAVTEVDMVAVPRLLEELLAAGRWPRNSIEANAQNIKPRVPRERLQSLAPEESWIYLLPPPFLSVREKSKHNPFWTWPMADPGGIDFDLALDIADFGIGSDAPILLDYRDNLARPRVIRLRWSGDGTANRWVVTAPDFETFVETLGL